MKYTFSTGKECARQRTSVDMFCYEYTCQALLKNLSFQTQFYRLKNNYWHYYKIKHKYF